ncbi:hypothetical protein QBC39DRAFT_6658 [Podospora conica]|nr:hypothetical protein QBC39DRAFT_6658 [Schizothecium conicum]
MAPPTGPRGGTARRAAPRGRGGGISKTRSAPRKDRDGDVAMDAPAGGDAGRGGRGPATRGAPRGAPRGPSHGTTRAASRLAQNVKNYMATDGAGSDNSKARFSHTTFKIYGVKSSLAAKNKDGGLEALISFIERKNTNDTKRMRVVRSIEDGDCVWISVNKDDASGVLRLNGYEFAGATITVTETTDRMPHISKEAVQTKEMLMTVLGQRYIPETKLLNLSALGADPILSSIGTFDSSAVAEKAFKALMQLAGEQYKTRDRKEAMQSVSLASNEINDVKQVYSLAFSLPDLKRLDLSNNRIDSFAGLEKWKGQFRYLEELHLTGNPIAEQPNFASELLQWFPSLQLLNGQQVRTPEQAAEALASLLPKPLPQFPSNLRDGENNVAPAFLQAFYPMYDTNRDGLLSAFYDDESWFSVTAIPDSGRNLPWKSYMKYSRNLHVPRGKASPLAHRLFIGGSAISGLWKVLPASRHPPLDPAAGWVVDCHVFEHLPDPTGNGLGFAAGLFINARGVYEESDPANNVFGVRTFSRTFVLGPSKPGAPHPYRVVSDQLTLHKWTPAPTPETAASTMQIVPTPVVPTPSPVAPVGVAVLDDATKNQLIQEVSNRTGMTLEYSRMCLDTVNANWNIDLALASFAQLKDSLPREAFLFAA